MHMTASADEAHPQSFQVGRWDVRPLEGILQAGDDERTLEPRVMQLLVYLAGRAGAVVSADQLLADVWKGPFYGDNPVHKCIAALRRALGDDAAAPSYIETLRRRGYRLIAPVSEPAARRGRRVGDDVPWSGRCPYVGLGAFSAEQVSVYCGRTRAVAGLLAAMRRQLEAHCAFVLVLGPSGIGKSSLLRAGVGPKVLGTQGIEGIRARAVVWLDLGREERPVEALARLAGGAAEIDEPEREPGALGRLVVVDHLEWVAHAVLSRTERASLEAALRRLCRPGESFVVAIARSDAYSALHEALPGLFDLKAGGGQYEVPPVSRGEIAEMIRRPARLAGLEFEVDPETHLRLDDALCAAATERPGSLPLLQVALERLYERREGKRLGFAAYRQIGGLDGAIARRAEQVYLDLAAEPQGALPSVLGKLVCTDADGNLLGGRSVARELLSSTAEHVLVDALIDARLLVADNRNGCPTFTLAHDALIREWPRAGEWMRDNKRLLSARERLIASAQRWMQAGQPPDLLLPTGAPLLEAREVGQRMPDSLQSHERRYLRRSQHRARRRRVLALTGLAALVASALCAMLLAAQARHAGEIAEQRRIEGEGVVDFLLDDLSVQLRAIGRLDLLNSVSAEATRYLDRARAPATAEHVLRRVRALRILAEVNAGRGELRAGLDAVHAARVLLDGIGAGSSGTPGYDMELGTVLYWEGYLSLQEGDLPATRAAWEGYREAASRLVEHAPDDVTARLEMSYALNNLGNLALREQRDADAQALFVQSIALKRELYASHPDRFDIGADLADSISWWGSALEQQGRLGDAMEQFTAQLGLLRAVAARRPQDRLWEYRLTTALSQMASLQLAIGHVDAARDGYAESMARLQSLVGADASNRSWRRDLVVAAMDSAWLESACGRRRVAETAFALADENLALLLASTDVPPSWRALDLRLRLRRLLSDRLDADDAQVVARARSLADTAETLAREMPGEQAVQLDQALALDALARATGKQEYFERALGVLQPRLRENAQGSALASDADTLVVLLATLEGLHRETSAAAVRQRLESMGYRSPILPFLVVDRQPARPAPML